MRAVLTRGLPWLLACAIVQGGCDAAPDAPRSPALPDPPPAAPARVFPDLRLDRLFAERPTPAIGRRNPFRFGPAPPTSTRPTPTGVTALAPPDAPVGRPPLPPSERTGTAAPDAPGAEGLPLRLIGIVEVGATTGRVAVLTDERGVYHGRAGDTVEGRYRLVAIGETSVELEDLTRGARLTLRLSGV